MFYGTNEAGFCAAGGEAFCFSSLCQSAYMPHTCLMNEDLGPQWEREGLARYRCVRVEYNESHSLQFLVPFKFLTVKQVIEIHSCEY